MNKEPDPETRNPDMRPQVSARFRCRELLECNLPVNAHVSAFSLLSLDASLGDVVVSAYLME